MTEDGVPQRSLEQMQVASIGAATRLQALRQDRARKASWSVVVGYLSRASVIIVSLVSVPLTLGYLDRERYGLWLIINAMIAYVNTTDLGFGLGLQNRVAEARGRGEKECIGNLLSTAFAAMVVVGLFVAVVAAIVSWLAPVDRWFQLSSPAVTSELRGTLAVTGLSFLYLLPMRMVTNAQTGYQEAYLGSLWGIAGSAMSLVALVLVIVVRGDMIALTLATFLLAQLLNVANMVHFLRRHPESQISWGRVDLRLLPDLFAISWQFFLLQICTAIIWQTGNLIIGMRLGPEEVVPYAVAFRAIWVPLNLLGAILLALWPAYAEARARSDWEWVRGSYRNSTVLTVLLAGLAAILLFVWGQDVIGLWAGPKAQGSTWLMAALCSYIVLGHWTNCNAILINALGKPIVQVYSGIVNALLNLATSLYLVDLLGITGVALGMVAANALVSCWFLAWVLRRLTEGNVSAPWRETLRVTSGPLIVSLIFGLLVSQALPSEGVRLDRMAIGIASTSACYAISAYLLSPEEWRAILRDMAAGATAKARLWLAGMQQGVGGRES